MPNPHLDLYELTMLSSEGIAEDSQVRLPETQRRQLEEHVRSCNECRELLAQQKFLARTSLSQMNRRNEEQASPCPSEQEWLEIAAGLRFSPKTHEQLAHATHCPDCAAVLKRVSEQLADEATNEESSLLSQLRSANPEWADQLAGRMQTMSGRKATTLPRWKTLSVLETMIERLAVPAAILALVAFGVWWFTYERPPQTADRLLADSYSEQRTLDLRMPQARFAPVAAVRGAVADMKKPTSLLEAEVMIAKQLEKRPDDPNWLDAQGRAELMQDNYAAALSALERAHQYDPGNEEIRADLASAYFLRGEKLKRAEDYGLAVELLGQVLQKNPENDLARFNRAIASERLFLYEQAIEDWNQYLNIDPSSPWAKEAQKRRAEVEEKVKQQKERSSGLLLTPPEFVAALRKNGPGFAEAADQRIERYFAIALNGWLQVAFAKEQSLERAEARQSLEELSTILASRHGDYWLRDFLRELDTRPKSQSALADLIDAVRTNETADLDQAKRSAERAEAVFRRSGNHPGELLAEFEASFADQLRQEMTGCLDETRARGDQTVAVRYPWLYTQFSLESAACSSLNQEEARKEASQALDTARAKRFPFLELRATTFLAALYRYMGDDASAWNYSTDGLRRYWQGDFPAMRGYSLYLALDYAAEDSEQWFLDAEMLKEASGLVASDPDLELRAMAKYRLANALTMTGEYRAAEQNLNDARKLFGESADGSRKNNLEYEAEIGLAKLALLQKKSRQTVAELEPIEAEVGALSDKDLVFDYFRNLGLAYFDLREENHAKQDLGRALALAEESLEMNRDERERLMWCRKADPVYRAMVQLNLSGPPRDALAEWEWFKGASLRGSPHAKSEPAVRQSPRADPSLSFPVPNDTAVISYAFLTDRTFAWVYTKDGVRQQELKLSVPELNVMARKFSDHCSRPETDRKTLTEEAEALYQKIFEPLEADLRMYKRLVVEPDQALWMVPFDALQDEKGKYLADRYVLTMSPGLDYLATTPAWTGISPETRILVAGDPDTKGEKPLEDAEEEAKGIARQFRYSKLLLKGDAGYAQIENQLGAAEVFHFSGHATASPDGVGLLLGDSGVMNAERVKISEFSGIRLAVLSACGSANGSAGVFDDRNSLARLLVGGGVSEVVASRWTVNSRATSALMQEFYAQLLAGKDVSDALREASQKLRAREEFAHPYYWASFSSFGRN